MCFGIDSQRHVRTTRWAWVAALILLNVLEMASVKAQGDRAEWCERQWEIVSADSGEALQSPYKDILARWQKYRGKCEGTIAYEARLALLYAQMNEPSRAREILKTLGGTKSHYDHLVEVAALQTELSEIMLEGETDKRPRIKAVEAKYMVLVRKYPNFVPAYSMLGGMQTALDEHQEAIRTLIAGLNHTDKDKRRSPNLWGVYRNLTVSFAETGDYRRALGAADVAFELKKGISSDPYFAFAVAKASAGTGDFKTAHDALNVIAAKVPRVRSDPKFKETVDFVVAKEHPSKQKQQ